MRLRNRLEGIAPILIVGFIVLGCAALSIALTLTFWGSLVYLVLNMLQNFGII